MFFCTFIKPINTVELGVYFKKEFGLSKVFTIKMFILLL